jgi:hypothetical protein
MIETRNRIEAISLSHGNELIRTKCGCMYFVFAMHSRSFSYNSMHNIMYILMAKKRAHYGAMVGAGLQRPRTPHYDNATSYLS